jgi:membrane protein required for colicin V production
MTHVDYLILAVVLLSALVGAFRGFLHEVIALGAWVLGIFCAWEFADKIEPYLGGLLSDPHIRTWAARILLFLAVVLAGTVVGTVVGHYVRLSIFSGTDRFLGFCFGLLRGALLISLLVMAGDLLHLKQEEWWRKSKLIPYAQHGAKVLHSVLD